MKVTQRELSVLFLAAWGFSSKEIARRLEISVKTAERQKLNAMYKLVLKDRPELMRFAVREGWLSRGVDAFTALGPVAGPSMYRRTG